MNLVEVTWLDAVKEDCTLQMEAIKAIVPATRHNVGYLVANEAGHVTLAFGDIHDLYRGKVAYDDMFTIPRCMIVEIKPATVPE